MVNGTYRSITRQEKVCIACGKILQDEERVYQISEGVVQSTTPTFLPTSSLGFVDETCFKEILDHVNQTLLDKKSSSPPLPIKR